MATTLASAVGSYLRAKALSRGTRNEYASTVRKWDLWGHGAPIEDLRRKDVREFLDWVHERAVADEGTNPGRTANKTTRVLADLLAFFLADVEWLFARPKGRPAKPRRGRQDCR